MLLLEFTMMLLFAYVFTMLSPITEAFIDSSLLACTTTPFLWRWVVIRDQQRLVVEQHLRLSNEVANQARDRDDPPPY